MNGNTTTPPELSSWRGERALMVGADPLPPSLNRLVAHARVTRIAADAPLDAVVEHAPYDLVIVTDPVRAVAWAWVRHLLPNGLLLCVLDPSGIVGHAALLRRESTSARGRFLAHDEGWPAPPVDPEDMPVHASLVDPDSRHARTNLPLHLWELGVPWFLAAATMPDKLTLSRVQASGAVRGIRLATADGSWCEITGGHPDGRRHVAEGGPGDLFEHLAHTHREWQNLGRPGWERLTLTVTADEHKIGLDDGSAEWSMPE